MISHLCQNGNMKYRVLGVVKPRSGVLFLAEQHKVCKLILGLNLLLSMMQREQPIRGGVCLFMVPSLQEGPGC